MFKATVSKGKISVMLIAFMVLFFGAGKCFAAPTAADSVLGLRVNTTATGKLSATGTGLTYDILATPMTGSVTGLPNSTGAYSYTPKPDYAGTDSFTFYVKDNTGATAVARVAITVSLENIAPTANPATFTVRKNKDNSYSSSFTKTLTGIDPEGAALKYSIDVPGSVSVSIVNEANGSFTYNPASMQFGGLTQDSFTFKVNDGTLDSEPAEVTINFISATTPPVVQSGTIMMDAGNVFDLKTKVAYAEGDLIGTFTIVSLPSKGTLMNFPDNPGLYMYQAASGQDTFTFKVSSPDWESAVATITIVAKMPPAAQDITLLTPKNTDLNSKVIATGDNLAYVKMSDPTKGTLTMFKSDGSYTYKPNPNYTGIDKFTFKANDGSKDSATATVTIIVGGIPGDVNGDMKVDLADAIFVLRLLAGIDPGSAVNLNADVNADGKIGLPELAYILQKVAALR